MLMFKLFIAIFEVIYDVISFYLFVCPGLVESVEEGKEGL